MTQQNNNNDNNWLHNSDVPDFISGTSTVTNTEYNAIVSAFHRDEATHQLRSGMDYYDNKLWYSVGWIGQGDNTPSTPQISYITSRNAIVTELPHGVKADKVKGLPPPFSTVALRKYLNGESVDGAALLNSLTEFFRRYAKFRWDTTPSLLAHWAAGTWMYMAFPAYAYIWLTSLKPQCGKSTVMEMVGQASFGHPDLWVDPTEAVLFRSIDQQAKVILVDEFERASEDHKAGLLAVFNAGHRRGATVPRVNKDNLNKLEQFHAYCPKMYAGLKEVPETLSSRSIELVMFPKTKRDNIQSWSLTDQSIVEQLRVYRDALAIWALTNAPACADLVARRASLGVPPWLDDRATDILYPLFAISAVAGTDRSALVQFCEAQAKVKAGNEDKLSYQMIECLMDWFPNDQDVARIHLEDIKAMLAKKSLYPSKQEIGGILRRMDIQVQQSIRAGPDNKNLTGVEIRKAQLQDLVERFVG